MMKRAFPLFILSALLFYRCGIRPLPERAGPQPVIKVGLVNGINAVEFSMDRASEITSHDGSFITRGIRGGRWIASVKGGSPGKTAFLLVAASMSTQAAAETMAREIASRGFETFIQPVGEVLKMGDTVTDTRKYRVYLKKAFSERASAAAT